MSGLTHNVSAQANELLDHIYEYGTNSEGVISRINSLCDAAVEQLRAELAASREREARMRQDADRYVWLIAHMGLVEREAVKWNPAVNKPLLSCLQDFIDVELPKAGNGWVEKQRAALAEGAQG